MGSQSRRRVRSRTRVPDLLQANVAQPSHDHGRPARTRLREAAPGAGFEIISEVDSSDESLAWFQQMRAQCERDGPPRVTFAAFLGPAFGQMAANQVANLAERRIRTVKFASVRPT